MSRPARPAVTAPSAKTPVHTHPVRISSPPAARGFAPVAYSFRPGDVRDRTSEATPSTTTHRTTTGGTGSPNVVPRTDVHSVSTAGGAPTMFDFVRTSTPLMSMEYMPRVTTRDCTAK